MRAQKSSPSSPCPSASTSNGRGCLGRVCGGCVCLFLFYSYFWPLLAIILVALPAPCMAVPGLFCCEHTSFFAARRSVVHVRAVRRRRGLAAVNRETWLESTPSTSSQRTCVDPPTIYQSCGGGGSVAFGLCRFFLRRCLLFIQ